MQSLTSIAQATKVLTKTRYGAQTSCQNLLDGSEMAAREQMKISDLQKGRKYSSEENSEQQVVSILRTSLQIDTPIPAEWRQRSIHAMEW